MTQSWKVQVVRRTTEVVRRTLTQFSKPGPSVTKSAPHYRPAQNSAFGAETCSFRHPFKHLRPTKPNTSYTNSKLFKSTFQSNNWLLLKINRFQVMSLQNWLKNHFDIFYKRVKCTKSSFQHSRLKTNVPASLKHRFTFRKTIGS